MNGKTVGIISFIFIIYLLLGAVLFHFIESPNELAKMEEAKEMRVELMANLTDMLTDDQIETIVTNLLKITAAGVNFLNMNETSPTNWDINSAFFFSGTVVTTIGKNFSFDMKSKRRGLSDKEVQCTA